MKNQGITALLLLSGNGSRFKSELPKQFHRLSGKKIYLHTLEKLIEADLFEEIILVCHPMYILDIKKEIDSEEVRRSNPSLSIKVIEGGSTRQESSYLGMLACASSTHFVLIHDAVRPFVSQRILIENLEAAKLYGAVDTCIASSDTVVYSPSQSQIEEIPYRTHYLRGQTPQTFSYALILEAHKHAFMQGIKEASDDCQLVLKRGSYVHIIAGDEYNIKITTELDLFLAEQILRTHSMLSRENMSNISLEGKKIAITGATGGIGKAVYDLLKKEGAIPISISRTSHEYPTDLTNYQSTALTFEKIYSQHGPLDALINSIGLFKVKNVEDLLDSEIEEMIAVNLTGFIFSCKSAYLEEKGHIINIASSSYSRGRKNFAVYSATKAAIVNFSQGFAEERPSLKVNVIVPQRTNTSMRKEHFPFENPATLLSPYVVAQKIIEVLKIEQLTGTIIEIIHK